MVRAFIFHALQEEEKRHREMEEKPTNTGAEMKRTWPAGPEPDASQREWRLTDHRRQHF